MRPRDNEQKPRRRLEWVLTAMGYQATADKDGVGASCQRAQLTRRVGHPHIVLDGERNAGGDGGIGYDARKVLKGTMAHHLIPTNRRHSQNIGHPVGVPWRKHR